MGETAINIVQYLPAIIMLVIGFSLVVVEMYIPGFGAPGIIGITLLIFGIVACRPSPLQALVMALVIALALCVAFSICIRVVSRGKLNNTDLVLNDVSTEEETQSDLNYFVGRVGYTHTALRPVGIAEFDGVRLNVISDGDYIEADEPVRVVRTEGNRIVVSSASADAMRKEVR